MEELTVRLSPIVIEWLKKKAVEMGYGNDINEAAGVLLEMMQYRESKGEN